MSNTLINSANRKGKQTKVKKEVMGGRIGVGDSQTHRSFLLVTVRGPGGGFGLTERFSENQGWAGGVRKVKLNFRAATGEGILVLGQEGKIFLGKRWN